MSATVHACPLSGNITASCCGLTPFELPRGDAMSAHPELVTCTGPGPVTLTAPIAAMQEPVNVYEHEVVIDFTDGYAVTTLRCNAPERALCHAEYECECESWFEDGVENGRPWHDAGDYSELDKERHYGKFVARCGMADWARNTDEWLMGEVTAPVRYDWQGDYYMFSIIEHPTPEPAANEDDHTTDVGQL